MKQTPIEIIDKAKSVENYIMHHLANNFTEWHLPFGIHVPLSPIISLHAIMLFICALALLIIFCFLYEKNAIFPTGMTNLLEAFIVFIRDDICIPSLGTDDGRKMAPLFCTFFFFILGLNLMGLIPLFTTATANINVTGGLACITLFVMIGGAILKNGPIGFIKAFIPHGVPIPVLFILMPIEFIGMFIKGFALMIRLFANMLAGHIVIFCLLGLIVIVGYFAALPAVILALAIYILEILVAFLQAYIFTLLSAMFIGMIHHPAH